MTHFIQSVLGPVDPAGIDFILAHEHLLIDYGELLGEPKDVPESGSDIERRIVDGIRQLAAAGGELLVDCTPPGYGRYPDLMAHVARETGVHIVASTGGFTEEWAPIHPIAASLSTEALADYFVRELREGMGGTRYRAGVIKIATGEGTISELESHIFHAAALAHRRTGAPIITHTTNGLGPEQAELLCRLDVDPGKIIIGHLGFEPHPRQDIAAVLRSGANLAFDRIGHHHFFPDSHWIDLIKFVLDRGGEKQLVLSHDAVTRLTGPAFMQEYTFSDYTYIPSIFLPALEASGIDQESALQFVRDNPRRILAFVKGGQD